MYMMHVAVEVKESTVHGSMVVTSSQASSGGWRSERRQYRLRSRRTNVKKKKKINQSINQSIDQRFRKGDGEGGKEGRGVTDQLQLT